MGTLYVQEFNYNSGERWSEVADRHPYSPGPGGVTAAINQFRKSFPKAVTADTLKKLGIAPKNESYVINILRFVGAIDTEGNRTESAASAFSKGDDEFAKDLEGMIRDSYKDLFSLHGDEAWALPSDKLKSYFRQSDQTSDLVGGLQAATFQRLAALAGHGQVAVQAQPRIPKLKVAKESSAKKVNENHIAHHPAPPPNGGELTRNFGLTVRVEINLPSDGTQETYDKIFRSIRENLLNGK